ncbi:MAG: hypothetical protein P1V35_03760 [Planctomycetota bacterium]|nr:hypothetical protein [Planctomycetota bacterium]
MIRRTSLVFAAAAVLSASAIAQTQQSALSVRIQSTFRAADVNKNGTISIREAAAAGIPPTSFAKNDLNKDRRLSSNEFGSYYQHLVVVRRKEQAKRVAETAKRKGRSFKPVGVTSKPNPTTQPKPTAQPAPPAGGQPVQGKPVQPAPVQPAPVQPAPVQSAPAIQPTADVVKKNRDSLQAEAVGKRFVKDLQSKGKLGKADADLLVQVLTLPAPGKAAAENFVEWRAALNNARTRIGALVQSKALTAEEGREMYLLFEQRAKDAVAWQSSGGVTQVNPAPADASAKVAGAKKANKVQGKVKGNVKGKTASVMPKPSDAENIAARKKAYAEKEAAKRAHDEQRVKDARARLAEQQAKEQAAKDLRIKEMEAKRRAAEAAKTAPKANPVKNSKPNAIGKKPAKAAPVKSKGGPSPRTEKLKKTGIPTKPVGKKPVDKKAVAPKKGA